MNQMSRREQNRLDKQSRIMGAALKVFAKAGFSGASMDMIAAEAELSKPTLYNHFSSKEVLFQNMMAVQRDVIMLGFNAAPDKGLVAQLLAFAWSYSNTVMNPEFLSLARLIIGEAQRFPNVGRDYLQSGPDHVLSGLMAFLGIQRDLGRLIFEDAELAAEDFWGLILSAPRTRALHVPDEDFSAEVLARYIHNGIRTFLRAYSTETVGDLARLEAAIKTIRVEVEQAKLTK